MITSKEWRPCIKMLRKILSDSALRYNYPSLYDEASALLKKFDDNDYLGRFPGQKEKKKAFKVHPMINLACYNVKNGTTGLDNLYKVIEFT